VSVAWVAVEQVLAKQGADLRELIALLEAATANGTPSMTITGFGSAIYAAMNDEAERMLTTIAWIAARNGLEAAKAALAGLKDPRSGAPIGFKVESDGSLKIWAAEYGDGASTGYRGNGTGVVITLRKNP
jgi:hypothetical protein